MISGPIDVLQFCGRRGKAALLDLVVTARPTLQVSGFEPELPLIDGDRAAMIGRLSGPPCASGRSMSYRQAQFMRFHDGRYRFRSIIDSFDAAEQTSAIAMRVGEAAAFEERRTHRS